MKTKKSADYYIGSLLGGAVGDALGAPVEFMSIAQIESVYGKDGVRDYVEFSNNHGAFTDDTQMTLFTAEGLLRANHRAVLRGIGGATLTITHHSYLRWLYTQGITVDRERIKDGIYSTDSGWLLKEQLLYSRRAPGNTCIEALRSGLAGSVEAPLNNSKGCGTIMRMAPVGLMFAGYPDIAFTLGYELSAITHGHPSGYLSGGFFAAVISALAGNASLHSSIEQALSILKQSPHYEETYEAVQKALALEMRVRQNGEKPLPSTISELGGGWVAEEALSMSLFAALMFENDFENGVLYAINHSGDSDSTGSVTGNILGLINGVDAINPRWITNLTGSDIVRQVAEDLYTEVKGDEDEPDAEWWEKYPGF